MSRAVAAALAVAALMLLGVIAWELFPRAHPAARPPAPPATVPSVPRHHHGRPPGLVPPAVPLPDGSTPGHPRPPSGAAGSPAAPGGHVPPPRPRRTPPPPRPSPRPSPTPTPLAQVCLPVVPLCVTAADRSPG